MSLQAGHLTSTCFGFGLHRNYILKEVPCPSRNSMPTHFPLLAGLNSTPASSSAYVFESTGADNKKAVEAIRIKREARLLDDSVYGKKASVTLLRLRSRRRALTVTQMSEACLRSAA